MTTRMLQRRGLASEWAAVNPILGSGEIGFVEDTGEIRIGDGVTHFESLTSPYYTPSSPPPYPVTSVAGRGGAVVLTLADIPGAYGVSNPPPYPVTSVAGRGGSVVLTASDVSGVYYAGNPPPYPVTSVAGRTGAIVLTDADVSGVYSAANPPPYPVTTVAGRTGAVVLTAADIGAGTFPGNATYLQNNGPQFTMASGSAGYIVGSGTQLKLRGGTTGIIVRNNADTATIWTLTDAGNVTVAGTISDSSGRVYSPGNPPPSGGVTSVAGRTGAVVLNAADIGPGTFQSGAFSFVGNISSSGSISDTSGRVYSPGNPPPGGSSSVTVKANRVVKSVSNNLALSPPSVVSNWSAYSCSITIVCGSSGVIVLDYSIMGVSSGATATNVYVVAAQSTTDAMNSYQATNGSDAGVASQYIAPSAANLPYQIDGIRVVTGLTPGQSYTFDVYIATNVASAFYYSKNSVTSSPYPWVSLNATSY